MYLVGLKHLDFFEKMLSHYDFKKTRMMPIWTFLSYSLRWISGKMGIDCVMCCTREIEKIVYEHYEDNLTLLNSMEETLLYKTIAAFQKEEKYHYDLASKYCKQENGLGFFIFNNIVSLGCRFAIVLSKKF